MCGLIPQHCVTHDLCVMCNETAAMSPQCNVLVLTQAVLRMMVSVNVLFPPTAQCPVCRQTVLLVPGEDPNDTWVRHSAVDCDPSKRVKEKKARCGAPGCREKLALAENGATPTDVRAAV